MMDQYPDLELQVAVAKVGKYAVSESGDTVELIERPHGGLSLVLVDGQRSGKSAKAISNLVARKAVSLLADGQSLAPHVPAFVREWLDKCSGEGCAGRGPTLADALLARAVESDQGRPGDDISVVVVSVVARQQPDDVRRLWACLPI